ncbi:MAG: T9SS type A sorting domain-containing protein, partial [Mariniphaga sp.]
KPDDTWYELRGSSHFLSGTIQNYEITYSNPGGALDVAWTDNQDNHGVVKHNSYHSQSYYPDDENFPDMNQNNYTLSGTRLEDRTAQGTTWVNYRFDYGYADNNPVNSGNPVTVPDNPYTLEENEGSGGDAFDISWAVDHHNNPVELDEIDFIKIYNGVARNSGAIGEVSTEIKGVVDVEPDASITGPTDVIISNLPPNVGEVPLVDEFEWPAGIPFDFEAQVISKGQLNTNQNIIWSSDKPTVAEVNNSGELTGKQEGQVKITATWDADNSVFRSYVINITPSTSTQRKLENKDYKLGPNPAQDFIVLEGIDEADVSVFNITGIEVLNLSQYKGGERINLRRLPSGLYILRFRNNKEESTMRFIKR